MPDQLLLTTKDLVQNYEENVFNGLIVLDFSKAFDVHVDLVPTNVYTTNLIITELGALGYTTFDSKFSHKPTQKVLVDGSSAHVGSDAAQGTVLGPILFPCYVNDFRSSVSSDKKNKGGPN